MDIFEHEAQYQAHLCEDIDDQLFAFLQEVLKDELEAQQVDKGWGLGGSQEISWAKFQINKEIVTVQSETYIGVNIFGPQAIVDEIMRRVQRKMQRHEEGRSQTS